MTACTHYTEPAANYSIERPEPEPVKASMMGLFCVATKRCFSHFFLAVIYNFSSRVNYVVNTIYVYEKAKHVCCFHEILLDRHEKG